jgi:hypothetical protein
MAHINLLSPVHTQRVGTDVFPDLPNATFPAPMVRKLEP